MKIVPKQQKPNREPGNYFYGDYGEIPVGISYAEVTPKDEIQDRNHYHKKGHEYYFVIQGKGILNVEGKEVLLEHNNLVMLDPGEKHFLKKAIETPFHYFVACSVDDKNDKVFV